MPASSLELKSFSKEMAQILPFLFREFVKRETNDLTRGNISFPQMVALDTAMRQEQICMSDLAKVLAVKMSSATVLVDRMIRQKMLTRKRDESDRRLVWIQITPQGRKIISRFHEEKQKTIQTLFEVLTPEERNTYLQLLKKVQASWINK